MGAETGSDFLDWNRERDGDPAAYATAPGDDLQTAPLTWEQMPEEVRRALHDSAGR